MSTPAEARLATTPSASTAARAVRGVAGDGARAGDLAGKVADGLDEAMGQPSDGREHFTQGKCGEAEAAGLS